MSTEITEALRRGDTAAALAAARRLAAQQPDSAEAHHLLGLSLQRSGDLPAAAAALARAVELAPEHAGYPFALANLAMSQGALDVAEKNARLATALDPNHLPGYVLAGQVALARRDRATAAEQLALARRVNEGHPTVFVLEGHIARFDGDEDLAMRCFSAAVQHSPGLAAAQQALGLGFLAKGQWPFAEQALANAHRLAPNNLSVAHALLEALRRQGKQAERLALLESLVAAHPAQLPLRIQRAELQAVMGQRDAALADLRDLLDRQPHHVQALAIVLELLRQAGAVDDCLALSERALAAAPRDDRLWLMRVALAANTRQDPRPVLDRWTAAMPDSAAAWDQLADFHQSRGELEPAADAARRALALEAGLPTSSIVLARQQLDADPAAALSLLESLRVDPGSVHSLRNVFGWRAIALDRLGRQADAARLIRGLAELPLPEERPLPAAEAASGEPAQAPGTLLWSLPGVRLEDTVRVLAPLLGDRLRPTARELEGADAGLAAFMPFVDAQALHRLGGARWLAVVADPRDTLLNWALFGSSQGYRCPRDLREAARWMADEITCLQALEAQAPGSVHWIRQDTGAAAGAASASGVLGVTVPAHAFDAPVGDGPTAFAPGHWRHYREAFADEFALLGPVAVALGYPAD